MSERTGIDILLAVSPSNARQEYMPFYFLYPAGYLEQHGFRVAIADPHESTDEANTARILAAVDGLRPRMVGLAAFVTDYDAVVALARRIKGHVDVPVIVGNAHPSVSPEDFLFDGAPFDLVVRGEGELTLREVLEKWDPGTDPDEIAGLAFARDGGVALTPPRTDGPR
jgi:anaerobic magnesium-protoporphyrin IX monomethyl ester cyclase